MKKRQGAERAVMEMGKDNVRSLKDCSLEELKNIHDMVNSIADIGQRWLVGESVHAFCTLSDATVVRATFMCMVKLCMERGIPLPDNMGQVYGLEGQGVYEDFPEGDKDGAENECFYENADDMVAQHMEFCSLSGIGDFTEHILEDFEVEGILPEPGGDEEDGRQECDFSDYPYMFPETRSIVSVIARDHLDDGSYYCFLRSVIRTSKRLGRVMLEEIPKFPEESFIAKVFSSFVYGVLGCGTLFFMDGLNNVSLEKDLGLQSITTMGYTIDGYANTEFHNILGIRPLAYIIDELMNRIEDGTAERNPEIYFAK